MRHLDPDWWPDWVAGLEGWKMLGTGGLVMGNVKAVGRE